MRTQLVLIAALSAVTLLVIAACGGDDSSGGSSEPLTKAEFIAAADAICTEADEKNNALPEPTSIDDAIEVLEDGLAIFEEQLEALQALTPPEADRAQIDRSEELLGQVNSTIADAADAFADDDLQGGQELLDGLDAVGTELDQIAADYGLEACGSTS